MPPILLKRRRYGRRRMPSTLLAREPHVILYRVGPPAGPQEKSLAAFVTAVEYDSAARRSPLVEEVRELVRHRDLVRLLVSKTIKTRYKRSSLGVFWTLLNPLLNMAVMTVAFSAVFRGSLGGGSYPVYLLIGLIFWAFFTQTTTWAMSTLVWGGVLLRRVYVPRSIFAVASIGNGLVNLTLSLLPLLGIMLVLGHPIHATWAFMPVALLLLAMFSLGIALLMSTLAVFFTDVVDLFGVALQAWFFLTPIIYPEPIVPPEYTWLVKANPMYSLLAVFRDPIFGGRLPAATTLLVAAGWSVAALVVGAWVFSKKADEFAYRL